MGRFDSLRSFNRSQACDGCGLCAEICPAGPSSEWFRRVKRACHSKSLVVTPEDFMIDLTIDESLLERTIKRPRDKKS